MSLWADIRRSFSPYEPSEREIRIGAAKRSRAMRSTASVAAVDTQNRSTPLYPDWDSQVMAILGVSGRPYPPASVQDALGVPAILRAVSLIANTTASLPVEGYRDGALLTPRQTPQIVVRPDPDKPPGPFWRDTAFYRATRGESWWWVARRDADGVALSLVVVPPWEVTVTVEGGDRRRPTIRWLGREMPREDMRQTIYLPDETGLRGVGPLQLCGAAVSIAVESQEWAANFFAEDGGYPSIGIKAAGTLSEDPETGVHEADTLRADWMSKPHNTPRVYDEGIEEIKEFAVNQQGAQMLEARAHEIGDAARMFGIPGSLLEYSVPGSSLTYQNVEGEYTKFVRTCLAPNYLEPIEQEMSDLLTRSTVARFNVRGILRADIKTRYEVHQIAIDSGIYGPEHAAMLEGFAPGDIEFAAVPPAPPAAVPGPLPIAGAGANQGPVQPYLEGRFPNATVAAGEPIHRTAGPVRCTGTRVRSGLLQPCRKLLAEHGPFFGTCPRCGREYRDENRAAPADPALLSAIEELPERMAPAPLHVTTHVTMPETITRLEGVDGRIVTLHEDVRSLAELYAERQAATSARLADLAIAQSETTDRLNQPHKPRTFIPRRDENGLIVEVTEAS